MNKINFLERMLIMRNNKFKSYMKNLTNLRNDLHKDKNKTIDKVITIMRSDIHDQTDFTPLQKHKIHRHLHNDLCIKHLYHKVFLLHKQLVRNRKLLKHAKKPDRVKKLQNKINDLSHRYHMTDNYVWNRKHYDHMRAIRRRSYFRHYVLQTIPNGDHPQQHLNEVCGWLKDRESKIKGDN